jgi:LysM repeat protein
MKKILLVLLTSLIIALQAFAFAPARTAEAYNCGDTYTVLTGDSLAKIAALCETSLSTILALNPQITNPNLVFPGQTLNLTGDIPATYTTGTTTTGNTTSSGAASVTVSTNRAEIGDDVTVSISGFPAYADVDYRVGPLNKDYLDVYDGTVARDGTGSMTVTIPDTAITGAYWVVTVTTTSQKDGVEVVSRPIYIGSSASYYYTSSAAEVSLSATRAKPGTSLTAYVSGFPENTPIDFRLGKYGKTWSIAYDGKTNSDGEASHAITLPASAAVGEYWVVTVITTGIANSVEVTSHTIYITN